MFTLEYEQGPASDVAGIEGGTRVQAWHDLADVVCAYGYTGPGWWAMHWPNLATFRVDAEAVNVVRVFPAAHASRARLQDLYRRSVVPLFLQALGHETLHASAVLGAQGVLAFCGERASGKSTIAYALARRGLPQYADDTLVMTPTSRGIKTQPLPFSPRLRPASAAYFRTHDRDSHSHEHKVSAPLSALFVLRPAAEGATLDIEALASPLAFQALLSHAHCFEPASERSRRRLLKNYLEVSASVPVFAVSYPPGLDRLDALLDAILSAAREAGAVRVAV
jgi:hypothetical protein